MSFSDLFSFRNNAQIYMLLFFFFGLSFFSDVFDFASLHVFTVTLTRPGNFEYITRSVDLKT